MLINIFSKFKTVFSLILLTSDPENQTFQEKYMFATEKNENNSEYSTNSYQKKEKRSKKSEGQKSAYFPNFQADFELPS